MCPSSENSSPSSSTPTPLDILIVGGGFAGVDLLRHSLKAGLSVNLFEAGGNFGGVWYWNNYPGARVDTDFSIYQYNDPELYQDFDYKERFPGRDELLRYFDHVNKKLNLSQHVRFNTRVTKAEFDDEKNLWKVVGYSENVGIERVVYTRFLVLCTGMADARYVPTFPGLETYKGELYHTSFWPKTHPIQWDGKKVGVIGTGASGVQVIQTIGPLVSYLTVYQRTPNLCLPMRQCSLPNSSQPGKSEIPQLLKERSTHFSGLQFEFNYEDATKLTETQRRQFYESLWAHGGFSFWMDIYVDTYYKQEVNDYAYAFWAEKTRLRIKDPRKRDLLAPLKQPHPFGVKRPSLEQAYFEVYNLPHVDLVDVNESPILEITETGVRTKNEGVVDVDILVLATGFDCVTGGLLRIDLSNGRGLTLKEKWAEGTKSALGLALAKFPNLFYTYGPQAPTAFANGPTCVETQNEWILSIIKDTLRQGKQKRVEPEESLEQDWTRKNTEVWNSALFPNAKSWYQGSNIPGKKVEPLNWSGGFPAYIEALEESRKNGWKGFVIS